MRMKRPAQRINGEAGFSIIELLIVITLLLLIIQLVLIHMVPPTKMEEAKRISQIFQQKLNWALQYADAHQKILWFTVLNSEHRVVITELGLNTSPKTIDSFDFPGWMEIKGVENQNRITIHANGTVDQGNTFTLYAANKALISLAIQLYTGSVHETIK